MTSLIRNIFPSVAISIFFLLVVSACEKKSPSAGRPIVDAKPFKLEASSKKTVKLADFKGRIVLLHFWASWCAPCLEEIPQLLKLASSWNPERIVVLAVTVDKRWSDAERVLRGKNPPVSWLTLIDPQSSVSEMYGTFEFPESYLISPDQKIIYKWVGPQNWESEQIQSLFKSVLSMTQTGVSRN